MKSISLLLSVIASFYLGGCAQKSECTRMLDVVASHIETTRKIQNEGMKQSGVSTQTFRDLAAEYRKFSTSLQGAEFSSDKGASSTSAPAAIMNKYRVASGQLAEALDKLEGSIDKNDVTEINTVQRAISDSSASEVQSIFDVSGYCQEY